MKWLKLFEEFRGTDLSELKNYLVNFSIPVDTWGTGKSKTLEHLLDELKGGECQLSESESGLVRNIEFVGIRIYYNTQAERFVLKEDRQEFNDGRTRSRSIPNSVSEKMKMGEDPLGSAIRGIEEELGFKTLKNQFSARKDLFYNGDSLSYPGLRTKYKGHLFICQLDSSQFNPAGYIEVQKDKKTFFVWHKI